MKDCPYCAEPVPEDAQKCTHCGESLVAREQAVNPRPTAVTVFAILNGVAGAFSLGMLLLQLLQMALMFSVIGGRGGPGMGEVLLMVGMTGSIYGLAGGCLIGAAIGLWRLRPWAHKLSIGCSVVSAILVLLGIAGMMIALFGSGGARPGGAELAIILTISLAFGGAFLVYWIAQAVILTRPKISAAFSDLK